MPLGDWEGGCAFRLMSQETCLSLVRERKLVNHEELVVPHAGFSEKPEVPFIRPPFTSVKGFLFVFAPEFADVKLDIDIREWERAAHSKKKEENKMKNRTVKAMMLGTAIAAALTMGSLTAFAEETTEAVEEASEEETEVYTGDASLDDPRNQDEIGEQELLVVSFGTSFNDNRRLTIGAIEADMAEAFPDYSVRRGFTSQIIIEHVMNRDGIKIDNVTEALDRAVENGVKTLVVQPTHLMNGFEYGDLEAELAEYADSFDKIALGAPLLTSDEDFAAVEKAIVDWTADYDDGTTAIVFMGHGTEADSNQIYDKMQGLLTADGYENYYVGTVEATPSLDDVIAALDGKGYTKVVLSPLMIVAGDHANNDMAGEEEGSWKKSFEDAGYEVECLVRGLGENQAIRDILTAHAQAAIDSTAE